ncbi:MAG: biotin/lipoyl-binding protein, partial [Anaerolineales bacterium]
MHPNPRRVLPVVLLLIIAGGLWWYFSSRTVAADNGAITASGTIEANEVNVSPELGGRVTDVKAQEGDGVKAGDVLIQFDTALLEAQRAQAAAALAAARAGHAAALSAHAAANANYNLLKAGPSQEQLAVAQTVVDKAQLAV